MRGTIGGLVTGGLVSVLGLGTASLMSEQPAGSTPPEAPLVAAPEVAVVDTEDASGPAEGTSPVGSVTITVPITPALPDGEAAAADPVTPDTSAPEATAPRADTDPLDEPSVVAIEGAMDAPDTSDVADFSSQPVAPVLPNPQSLAPAVPNAEADLTVSTAPAQPVIVVEPEADAETPQADAGSDVSDLAADDPSDAPAPTATDTPSDNAPEVADDADAADGEVEVFVIAPELSEDQTSATPAPEPGNQAQTDAGAPAGPDDTSVAMGPPAPDQTAPPVEPSSAPDPANDVARGPTSDVASLSPDAEAPDAASDTPQEPDADANDPMRLQLQGSENALLANRDTGVTIRRPSTDDSDVAAGSKGAADTNALSLYSADVDGEIDGPVMSITLIDDGRMSAASAALSGLPFPVTIALDPSTPDARALMQKYRDEGFEVVALAKVPEGAQPSDVEVTLESVFATLPEAVAVVDLGQGGLQADRAVTEQVMSILAAQGRGYATVARGLNMATRAAGQAGVPAVEIYRDLDPNDQDARIVRRFVDQAAFRARQESGVVLVGRVRPDTISALILWGTANQRTEVDLVPLSAILLAESAE